MEQKMVYAQCPLCGKSIAIPDSLGQEFLKSKNTVLITCFKCRHRQSFCGGGGSSSRTPHHF